MAVDSITRRKSIILTFWIKPGSIPGLHLVVSFSAILTSTQLVMEQQND